MKLPTLASIIFFVTAVMTSSVMFAFATSYAMDAEYYSSEMRMRFVTQMVIWMYFFVFSVAALGKRHWGIAGYRLGLIASGLLMIIVNFFGTGRFSAGELLFMLPITVIELGFFFAIWKYLGSKGVMTAYPHSCSEEH